MLKLKSGDDGTVFDRRQSRENDKGERQPACDTGQPLDHNVLLGQNQIDHNPSHDPNGLVNNVNPKASAVRDPALGA
jgi:hypothetical protein